jgi:hypothetical protein
MAPAAAPAKTPNNTFEPAMIINFKNEKCFYKCYTLQVKKQCHGKYGKCNY